MSTSIKGRRPVPWKKAKTRRTVTNAEINFRRHLCNVADDDSPVESRRADRNHILIVVVARELHGVKLTFWVLDGFTTLKYIVIIISVRSGSERPVVDL